MEKYYDDSWFNVNRWGKWGEDDEVGVLNELNPELVLKAVSLIKKGKVYDLETERFKGMPIWSGHCGFDLLSYASAKGRKAMLHSDLSPDYSWYAEGGMMDAEHNQYEMGCNTEMLIAPLHAGTHIDALCHWSTGEDNHYWNGYSSDEYVGNFGPTKCDIAKIPPMVMRGVLLDIAGYKGVDHLPPNYIITPEDCAGCAEWEGVELREGDAVFMRVGERWPQADTACDAGVGVPAARYLVEEKGAFLLGDDMACIDGFNADGSSSVPHHPQPTHHYLLIQQGIHIIELIQLDELAKDKAYEFCFICTPTKVKGATGMYIRPIAIV